MADDAPQRTRLSTKGQVVLPKEVRARLHWEPGAELVVESTPDGVLLKRAPVFPPTAIDDVYGCLHVPGRAAKTLKDMDAAIATEAKRRHARGRY